MNRKFYLENPCKASSLPFWKTNTIKVPDNMKVVLEEELQALDMTDCTDEAFFKLLHPMKGVEKPVLDSAFKVVACDTQDFAEHIADCYDDIGISCEELENYKTHSTYDESLWIVVKSIDENEVVASGIAELDTSIKEGVLEWIQVLPSYRGRGLGKFIVRELLWRMKDKADFVTVSGKVHNPSNPKELYEACGFTGEEIWHVIKKRQ